MTITLPSLDCTIKTLDGNVIVAEPIVGKWYTSIDCRHGQHAAGVTARYVGCGDFISEHGVEFPDACGVHPGISYLLEVQQH